MILYNANLVTMWPSQPMVDGALVAIEGKSVVDFGKMGKLIDRYDDNETVDVGGRVVVPGMIDAHARLTRCLGVGRNVDVRRLERVLDSSAIYAGASVALMDALRSGVTTVFAFHSSPSCVNGSAEVLSRAFADVGVRGSIGHAVSADADFDEVVAENASQLARSNDMLRGLFGLQVSLELDEKKIVRCAERALELGAQLHVVLAETREELDTCLSYWGTTPIGRLRQLGSWDGRGFSVRAAHRLPADEAVLRESGTWLVDCPLSDMIGAAPSPELSQLRASESRVATGTDGLGGGMVEEFRRAVLRQRSKGLDLESATRLAFWSSFHGNADMATAHFGPPLGSIRPGARADLVVLDYVPSTPLDASNLAEHVFSSPSMNRVHTVIVNGRILYQNGEFVHVDEARLRARAREISKNVLERI